MRRRLLSPSFALAVSLLAGSLAFAALLSTARSAEAPWPVSASRSGLEAAAPIDPPAPTEAPEPPLPLGEGWGGGPASSAEVAAFAAEYSAALVSASAGITLQASSHTFAVPRLVQGVGASTRIVVQNPDTDAADVTVIAYEEGGRQAARQSLTIAALGQATVRSDQLSLSSGFVGSAIVGADREIAVAVEETTGAVVAAYGAVGRPSPVAAFPLVRKSGTASTTLALQNVTDRAAEVTLTFSATGGGGAALSVPTISLPPFGSRSLNLATITEIPEGFVGAALARANNVAIAGAYVSPTSGIGYGAFGDGSEALLLPLSRQWRSTAGPTTIAVQNLDPTPVAASVVRHRAAAGSHPPQPLLLAPGAAATIPAAPAGQPDDVESITLTAPSGSRLAAVVEAGPSLVRGVPASSGASYLPHAALDALFIQNLGQEEATIFALFLDGRGATVASDQWTLAPGEAATRSARELGLPTGFAGSAIILGPAPLGVVAR